MARRWRASLNTLADQLTDGWALLVGDASGAFSRHDHHTRDHHTRFDAFDPSAAHDLSQPAISAPDPIEQALRRRARQSGVLRPPSDFTARVLRQLPGGPPPFGDVLINPYEHLRREARLVVGTLSFSALLMFGSTWLLAVVEPTLALTILAGLVSALILMVEGLRVIWQTAAGAASNPIAALAAMSAPLAAFLIAANHFTHHNSQSPDQRLREA